MKLMKGCSDRDKRSRSIFTHNGFTYELISEYGNFPPEFEFLCTPEAVATGKTICL